MEFSINEFNTDWWLYLSGLTTISVSANITLLYPLSKAYFNEKRFTEKSNS